MTGTVLLVPRRGGNGIERDISWGWLRAFLERRFPRWPIFEAPGPDGPFNKSAAVNQAAAAAGSWDVAIMVDADSFVSARQFEECARRTAANGKFTIPHDRIHYLSEDGSAQVMAGYTGDWSPFIIDTLHGGCSSVIGIPRRLFDVAGGMDERFVGWGEEDVAFSLAMQTFGRGYNKMTGDGWHLWHPTRGQERDHSDPGYLANLALRDQYVAARGSIPKMTSIRSGDVFEFGPSKIPRRIIRTVPKVTTEEVDGYWAMWARLHPGWEMVEYRDPISPKLFPLTSKHWARCGSGAQMAGLVRLEEVFHRGGVYVDSDLEPLRNFEPLLQVPMFAGWEDEHTVPDFCFGAEPGHPAVREMIDLAIGWIGQGAWKSGPGAFTATLPGRPDCLLMPPGAFAPYHYHQLGRKNENHGTDSPWAFAVHHWAHSWK